MIDQVYWHISEAGNLPGLGAFSPENVLHAEEYKRWQGMKIEKRANEWLHGRLAAKQLLTSPDLPLHGTQANQIHIANHPEGAPYIALPQIPGNLSISHRDKLAAAAYTQSSFKQVGIDLEKIEPRAWSFIEDFFTQDEADHTRSLSKQDIDLWATLVWSAKEAVLKVWQKGLRLDTRSVEIMPTILDGLRSSQTGWQPLEWQAHLDGFPNCWLCWQRWGEYIITLAGEIKKGDSGQEPPIIQKV